MRHLLVLAVLASLVSGSAEAAPASAQEQRALLDRYCVGCHNQSTKTAGLALDVADVERVSGSIDLWEKVVRKLRTGAMPPAGQPRPTKTASDAMVAGLEAALDGAARLSPNPGRPAIHRLNRTEYTNAIRDLLALEIDGRALLPPDTAGYGFDNIADALSVSPGLLERYLTAARKISRAAVGDPTIRPWVETYRLPFFLLQNDRTSEDLPAGSRGGLAVDHQFPVDGEYVVRVRLQRDWNENIRGLDEQNVIEIRVDGVRVRQFTLGGKDAEIPDVYSRPRTKDLDADLFVRLPVKAGPRQVAVALQKRVAMPEGVRPTRMPVASFSFAAAKTNTDRYGAIEMGVESLQVEGPFNPRPPQDTPSRRRIFECRPNGSQPDAEMACARTILASLARRAFRRPATERDIQALLADYRAGRAEGDFDMGIQWVIEHVVTDPDFLFRSEHAPPGVRRGQAYRITDIELASRLSFFLWSSIPDEELLALAVQGQLKDPVVFEQQVRRMLAARPSKALIDNFFGQWLHVRNVRTVTPDPTAFPEFDENLRQAFERETELFIESQVREDRSVVDLLTADYTFVNERLARHYGIPHIYGDYFRRVTFADDRRAGLLGHGSILTVTSYANRTSPVKRGKWLLENLLGTPPPPPPGNVPPFPENAEGASAPKSVRERMEMHRRNPVCASCHARLDPLGFAFENFDAVGKWRTMDEGTPIDPSGAFPNGARFSTPSEFRTSLLGHREEFIATVSEKLLTYALGRGLEPYDMPAVRRVLREAKRRDYRWSALILAVTQSVPFQMRRAE